MIEVFKTDVNSKHDACMLMNIICSTFPEYEVNFDLEDCDKVLRVKNTRGEIHSTYLTKLLKDLGFKAEVLPDVFPGITTSSLREPEPLVSNF